MMRWFIIFIIFGVFLAPLIALSEEAQPCKAEGATVVCTRPGFDVLVGKVLEARQTAERCKLEREADAATARVVEARLSLVTSERELALARVRELEARPFPRGRMFAAVGLGLVAGMAAAAAPSVSSDVAVAGLAGTAVVSAAAAAVLILME